MAKRLVDTAVWKEAWFRRLTPAHKCVWRFLCDDCDMVGVWPIDEEAITFFVGESVDLEGFIAAVNADGKNRIVRVSDSKLLLAGFIAFQYGELSEASRVHQSVIKLLKKHTLWEGYLKGWDTLSDECSKGTGTLKDKDKNTYKEKDKEKDKEGGVGGDFRRPAPVFDGDLAAAIEECGEEFRETLRFFKQGRTLLETERLAIGRAIQQHGATAVKLALAGARYEPKSETFNPSDWVDLTRYLDPKNFKRMLGYGVKKASGAA